MARAARHGAGRGAGGAQSNGGQRRDQAQAGRRRNQGLNETLEARVKARTDELARSNIRFSQAFHANPIPACMTTLGEETFVEVNDAFCALTGYTKGKAVGRTSRELRMWSSPEDRKKLGAVQQGGLGFRNLELGLRVKDGGDRTVLMSAEVIRLGGHKGFLRMFFDVTEQRRTQEQTHQAIQEVLSDTNWFSQRVMERLAHIRTGSATAFEATELSKRERAVLELLAGGLNNAAIAAELGLAAQTVRNYVATIYDKLEVHSRTEAVVWARERGIVS